MFLGNFSINEKWNWFAAGKCTYIDVDIFSITVFSRCEQVVPNSLKNRMKTWKFQKLAGAIFCLCSN